MTATTTGTTAHIEVYVPITLERPAGDFDKGLDRNELGNAMLTALLDDLKGLVGAYAYKGITVGDFRDCQPIYIAETDAEGNNVTRSAPVTSFEEQIESILALLG